MAREKSTGRADSYYVIIKGEKYDRRMLELAEGLTQGRGDGRISINDAKNLLRVVKDSNNYSETEKRTMEYIRKKYKFTKEADVFFRSEIRKWAATRQKKRATLAAEQLPVAASQPTENTPQAAPANTSLKEKNKKSSPWLQILLVLLILIVVALVFYFVTRSVTCAASQEKAANKTAQAPAKLARPSDSTVPNTANLAALKEFVSAQKLSFRADQTELTSESAKVLDLLAERLKGQPIKIQILGHSCALGSKAIKQQISEQRAQVVKEALIARGLSADQIETRGVADSQIVGNNRTAASRIASRRVTFRVIE